MKVEASGRSQLLAAASRSLMALKSPPCRVFLFLVLFFFFWVAETQTAPNWNSEILLSATALCVILFFSSSFIGAHALICVKSEQSRDKTELSPQTAEFLWCQMKQNLHKKQIIGSFFFLFFFFLNLLFFHYWNKLLVACREIRLSSPEPVQLSADSANKCLCAAPRRHFLSHTLLIVRPISFSQQPGPTSSPYFQGRRHSGIRRGEGVQRGSIMQRLSVSRQSCWIGSVPDSKRNRISSVFTAVACVGSQ